MFELKAVFFLKRGGSCNSMKSKEVKLIGLTLGRLSPVRSLSISSDDEGAGTWGVTDPCVGPT